MAEEPPSSFAPPAVRPYGLRDPSTLKRPSLPGENSPPPPSGQVNPKGAVTPAPSSGSASAGAPALKSSASHNTGTRHTSAGSDDSEEGAIESAIVLDLDISDADVEPEDDDDFFDWSKDKRAKASKPKPVVKKPSAKKTVASTSKKASAADTAVYDDPTDDDDAPTPAHKPARKAKAPAEKPSSAGRFSTITPSGKTSSSGSKVTAVTASAKKKNSSGDHIDLTGEDSQEYEAETSRPSKAPTKKADTPSTSGSPNKAGRKHIRHKEDPEAALDAAKKAWKAAHDLKGRQTVDASVGKKSAADCYLFFKEPIIAEHPVKGEGVGFWCKDCCPSSTLVWRPFSDSSTSNLRSHVNSKTSLQYRLSKGQSVSSGPMDAYMVKGTAKNSGPPAPHLSVAQARQLVVEWVTSASRPLAIIEDSRLAPLFPPELRTILPGRKIVGQDVERIYNGMIDVVRERLAAVKGVFHIALDVWTSKNGNAFLGIMVNYQVCGVAQRHLLDMIPFLASHDAKNIARAIHDTLTKYSIASRVWNIVADNASENTAMLPILSGLGGMPRYHGVASQVRCFAHVLNLVTKAIANPFVRATKSIREDESEEWLSDSEPEEDEGDLSSSISSLDGEDSLGDAEECSGSVDKDDMLLNSNVDELGTANDPLEEDDVAISAALHPLLTADATDDAELAEILGDRVAPVRGGASPTRTQASSGPTATPEQQEQELRNGEIGLQIKKLAWLGRKVHYSPTARRSWKRECKNLGLKKPHTLLRDVATRWDSTQQMIERGMKLWDAIISWSEKNPKIIEEKHRLRRSDKASFDSLLSLLTPIAKATAKFCNKRQPTIGDVVGSFENLDTVFSNIINDRTRPVAWRKAAERGRKVVLKYYGFSDQAEIYRLAVLLHPNCRKRFLEAMKWEKDWIVCAEDILRSNFNDFYRIAPEDSSQDVGVDEDGKDGDDDEDMAVKAMERQHQLKRNEAEEIDPVENWFSGSAPLVKIDYGNGKKMKKVFVDPLDWWWKEKAKGNEWMGLADMALDVFSCPATSVDVERLFSRARRNVSPLRHRMKAKKLSKIVTVGQWVIDKWIPEGLLQDLLDGEEYTRGQTSGKEAQARVRS
ncbi:hypothetical protein CF327_g3711 [Tilletia walkeri]|uniref:HAT C-terminal dimerisation domain-containing protein n=1 Tax=Tilletia walkeri TaxID=117179 RepID=A0A8X7NC85_9BASI|nr:hypothetical protein CF327_g3711 [Tilletia walkeri]KAE8269825.1 hypothetical protein A4X09_0g2522 [Tilletia walkeri]